jgi:hypothetical protein
MTFPRLFFDSLWPYVNKGIVAQDKYFLKAYKVLACAFEIIYLENPSGNPLQRP